MNWKNPFKKSFQSIGVITQVKTIDDAIAFYFGGKVGAQDKASLMQAGIGAVYTCSAYISNSVASQKLRLYKPSKQKKTTKALSVKTKKYLESKSSGVSDYFSNVDELEEITDHDVLKLLKNVNRYTDGYKFSSATEFQLCLIGSSYWYVIRTDGLPPIENGLHLLPSEQVIIEEKKGKDDNGNEYFREIDYYKIGTQTFKPYEIIQFTYPNPRVDGDNWKYGMSPLHAVIAEYNISGKLKDLQYDFAMTKPANQIYLQTEVSANDYTEDQKKQIKIAYESFTGGNPDRKLMVIDKGGKLTEIPHSAKDLPFIDNLKGFREFIFNAYQMPLSFVENSGSNRAIQDRQDTQYLTHCIYPKLMMRQSTYNSFLIAMYSDLKDCFFAYDNCIPEDELNELKINMGYVQAGIWSPNDVLISQGREPYDGGDTHFINGAPIGVDAEEQGKAFAKAIKKELEGS